MKTLNKFFYALLALATVGMVACTETDTYEPGAPEIESCYDVYFPDAATLETQGPTGAVELDPADATEFTYTAYRNNTEGAVTVPVVVTANTQEKFTVSEIVFEEGSDVAEFTVSLNESEIGVPYTLSFAINDPQYVKQYESANANSISLTVTRVKWNDVGVCSFTEDILTSYWNFGFNPANPTYDVKVQVRADSIKEDAFKAALDGTGSDAGLSGIYRLVNPYRVGPWADPEDTTLESDPTYLVINANPYNQAYIDLQELGLTVNGGMTSVYSLVAFYKDNAAESNITSDMYGKIEGGTLRFNTRTLLMCPGGEETSNTFYSNLNGNFALVLAPALGKYSLTLPEGYEDGDFTFTEMELDENAIFYSESQAAAWYPILEEGRPNVSTDDADRNFVAQYGLMYRLPNLYAEGYPIYFAAKTDGTVTVPAGFEEQKTGLVQNGYDVYMAIDAKASKFNPETGELALVAEFYSYQGKDVVSYGVYNEVISTKAPDFPYAPAMDMKADFEYTALFTDKFTSAFQDGEWTATLEKGTCTGRGAAAFEKQHGTAYRIPAAYVNGYDIYFVADAEGKVSVPAGYELQPTGVNIYGTAAYLKILKGTLSKNGVTFDANICNAEGKLIMPALCTETLLTYIWNDVATGSWKNSLFKDPFTGLAVQQAEGTNIFRVVDAFSAFTGVTGTSFMFSWDSKTNKCDVMGLNDTGIACSALGVGAPGNIHFIDALSFMMWAGEDVSSWEDVTALAGGDIQSFYDPATLKFTFIVAYAVPDEGAGAALQFTGGATFVAETLTLDEAPQVAEWADYAVGNFTHTDTFWLPESLSAPYTEEGIVMQRFGATNKYRLMVVDGQVPLELTFDEAIGTIKVPAQKTGQVYQEDDGSLTDILWGDVWGIYSVWNEAGITSAPEDGVYGKYPNSYDATTKTLSFYLGYFDQYGYTYTDATPSIHTFQITGDAPAASTASTFAAPVVNVNNKVKASNLTSAKFEKKSSIDAGLRLTTYECKSEKKVVRSMKTATPVARKTRAANLEKVE